MGGSGVGGVTWFFASDSTHDSEGCNKESTLESVEKFLTEVGERPGAMSGLKSAGIHQPQSDVNLCILRPPTWIFRPGKVDLIWIPDQGAFRRKGKEDIQEKGGINIKTEL
jgi:hypothetical protein